MHNYGFYNLSFFLSSPFYRLTFRFFMAHWTFTFFGFLSIFQLIWGYFLFVFDLLYLRLLSWFPWFNYFDVSVHFFFPLNPKTCILMLIHLFSVWNHSFLRFLISCRSSIFFVLSTNLVFLLKLFLLKILFISLLFSTSQYL